MMTRKSKVAMRELSDNIDHENMVIICICLCLHLK